jgi:hypothetical protein
MIATDWLGVYVRTGSGHSKGNGCCTLPQPGQGGVAPQSLARDVRIGEEQRRLLLEGTLPGPKSAWLGWPARALGAPAPPTRGRPNLPRSPQRSAISHSVARSSEAARDGPQG